MGHTETLDNKIDQVVEQTPNERFRFSDPHWLRQGQYVELTWIAPRFELTTELVAAEYEDQSFTYERKVWQRHEELRTVAGTITKAFSRRRQLEAERAQGHEPHIRFTPDRQPMIDVDGNPMLCVPGTITIPESDFDSYIFTGLPRSVRWADREASQS